MVEVLHFMGGEDSPRRVLCHLCGVTLGVTWLAGWQAGPSERLEACEYLVNIVSGRRTAQKRVTGGRWRRIVLATKVGYFGVKSTKAVKCPRGQMGT